jgi:hypothetical protein
VVGTVVVVRREVEVSPVVSGRVVPVVVSPGPAANPPAAANPAAPRPTAAAVATT